MAGRTALIDRIAADVPAPVRAHRARRTRRWSSLVAVGATTAAVAVVAVNVFGISGWRGGADPAAASVLEAAASATLAFTDPVVAADQYLRVETEYTGTLVGILTGGVATQFIISSGRSELYVPGNRDEDWVWVQCAPTTVETFGPDSEELAAQIADDNVDTFRVAPGGELYEGANLTGNIDYTDLPRDANALLDTIYDLTTAEEGGPAGRSRDGAALTFIADTLRIGTVPADLRAALYRAAAKIPGVTITEEQVTLNGSTGIALGRLETAGNIQQDIIIDPKNGQFIGEREIALDSENGIPPGTITQSAAVTTTVVNTAPTDTSLCTADR
ncbi:hypothetical protein A8L33_14150 [Microbacterium aurantiacum]|uniref:Uncharacterized protein n=2 Tax=Microbacterium aurantiacum TaxID=162393 RepID=A0A0M9VL37_9MICO|nr:hypothetical protein A8L33_14150 [Microbacterium chocolatum]KOS10759.1 hypothetical protein XI38_08005 [Microbacterium chocolatum]